MCSSAGAAGNEAQQVQDELQQIEDERAAQSDEYPVFQLIPKEMLVGKGKSLRLLPNDMGRWHTKVRTTCTSCTAVLQPWCIQTFAYTAFEQVCIASLTYPFQALGQ